MGLTRRGFGWVTRPGQVWLAAFRLGPLMWQWMGASAFDDGLATPHEAQS